MPQEPLVPDSIDDVATLAISLGRQVQQQARRLNVGGNSVSANTVSRALQRLEDRDPFHELDRFAVDVVRGHLERDIRSETIRVDKVPSEHAYDAQGNHIGYRLVPVRTDRGHDLAKFQELFEAFAEAREATLDRLAAHKALIALMQ